MPLCLLRTYRLPATPDSDSAATTVVPCRTGRQRPVILASLAVFVCASLSCLLATDVWTFLLFRTMQAAIVSGLALSRVIIRMRTAPESSKPYQLFIDRVSDRANAGPNIRRNVRSTISLALEFLSVPCLWRAMLALCWFYLGETNKNPSRRSRSSFRHSPVCSGLGDFGYSLCIAFSIGALYAFLSLRLS